MRVGTVYVLPGTYSYSSSGTFQLAATQQQQYRRLSMRLSTLALLMVRVYQVPGILYQVFWYRCFHFSLSYGLPGTAVGRAYR